MQTQWSQSEPPFHATVSRTFPDRRTTQRRVLDLNTADVVDPDRRLIGDRRSVQDLLNAASARHEGSGPCSRRFTGAAITGFGALA